MAIIREEGKPLEQVKVEVKAETKPLVEPPPSIAKTTVPSPATGPGRLRISPAARQLAAELGIDPSTLKGTGPDGSIVRDDVLRAAQVGGIPFTGPFPLRGDDKGEGQVSADRQTRIRQTIAAAMARSKREIPHYYLSTVIDMGRAMTWLKGENLKRPVADRLLYGV
jgi:pyruvate dehydrogenase E2 component (dihydrolipoamide acetyltransferase)